MLRWHSAARSMSRAASRDIVGRRSLAARGGGRVCWKEKGGRGRTGKEAGYFFYSGREDELIRGPSQ